MRYILLHIVLIVANLCYGQLFNNGATFHVESGGVVAVKGTDFINNGDVTHKGYLLVDRSITNDNNWTCNDLDSNTIELGLHWTNNDSFISGTGAVNFIGDNQDITGLTFTGFYDINLRGASLAVKSMGNHVFVNNRLNLNKAEMATNNSTLLMMQASNEITRQTGFVSTKINGRLNRDLKSNFGSSNFPLGHNRNGRVIYSPIFLTDSDTGTFRTAFIYDDASDYGWDVKSFHDSLCTVNDEFFHIVGSSSDTKVDYGIATEDYDRWTKLADWNSTQWLKISPSKADLVNGDNGFTTTNYSSGDDIAIALATEAPFVEIEEKLVYVPYNSSFTFEPDYYRPASTSITWTPDDYLSCDGCETPVYTAGEPETYTVELDNGSGCLASDTVQVIVVRGEDNPILIPNAFSPNGDGLNEVFRPYLYSFEELISLSVFNRWGEKLYEGTDGWDGTYMGKPVHMGAYIWVAEIREIKKGGFFRNNHLGGTVSVIK